MFYGYFINILKVIGIFNFLYNYEWNLNLIFLLLGLEILIIFKECIIIIFLVKCL